MVTEGSVVIRTVVMRTLPRVEWFPSHSNSTYCVYSSHGITVLLQYYSVIIILNVLTCTCAN